MKTPVKVAVLVVVLGAAVLLFIRNRDALDPAAAEIDAIPTYWLCIDPSCRNEIVISTGDLRGIARTARDELVNCPKCSQHTGREALPCPFCNRLSLLNERGKFPTVCPQCSRRNRPDDTHGDPEPEPAHKDEGKSGDK